jgi:two-component system response regulator VicR
VGRQLLLADDDAAVAEMYRLGLENAGIDVVVAHDGEEAIAEMTRRQPTVAVLDLQMPKADGLAVLTWMRSVAHVDVPAVILTNSSDGEKRAQAEALGIAAWLVKSQTRPRQLVQLVKELGLVLSALT